jgi:hypothetical protein
VLIEIKIQFTCPQSHVWVEVLLYTTNIFHKNREISILMMKKKQ